MDTYFNKIVTNQIKGIAIIMMLVHHFFTFPSFYIQEIQYPVPESMLGMLSLAMKMCVPTFAFLTGYFYSFGSNKTLKYTFKKILDLLIHYWVVFIPFAVLAVVFGDANFTSRQWIMEIFSLRREIMLFCWYVPFYCVSLLILCALEPILRASDFAAAIIAILPAMVASKLGNGSTILEMFGEIEFFSVMIVGYLCGKHLVFLSLFDSLIKARVPTKWLHIPVYLGVATVTCLARYFAPGMELFQLKLAKDSVYIPLDILYTPLFVYSVVGLLQMVKSENMVGKLLNALGKQSLMMWFVHALFFNISREHFQWILYLPKNPVLVLLWGTVLCYGLAVVLNCIAGRMILIIDNKGVKNETDQKFV